VNCASASCEERSSAAKIKIDAPNKLDDPTFEIGQARGVIIEASRYVMKIPCRAAGAAGKSIQALGTLAQPRKAAALPARNGS
jgi:hypothetical protein